MMNAPRPLLSARLLMLLTLLSATLPASALELLLRPEAPEALIREGSSTEVEVVVTLGDSEPGTFEVLQFFTDRYGVETRGETLSADLSDRWTHRQAVPVEHYGASRYRVEVVSAGNPEPVVTGDIWLVRPVPVPELTDAERLASPIGINVHHGAHWETLQAFGVHWARDYSWSWLRRGMHVPKAANHTDFGKKLEAIQAAGIEILPVMQRVFRTEDKRFFIPRGDVIRDSYERLSNGFPDILYWELDNESNLAHRDETTEDYQKYLQSYVKYIRNAHIGLQAAGHGAKVALDGEAGIHPDRAKFLLDQAGDSYSVVNYHYYTGAVAPEIAERDINTGAEDRPQTVPFLDIMRQMNQLAKTHGKETWLSEIAWSAEGGPEVGFRLQSAYLNRIYLLAAWADTDKVFWFWDRNMGGQGRFSGTGLIDMESDPKVALPAGAAMAAVSKFIARAEYAGSVDIGEDRWCLLFRRPEGGWLAAAWAVGTEFPLLDGLENASEAFDMYGNPLRDRILSDEPGYFYLEEPPAAWLAQREVEWVGPRTVNLYQNDAVDLVVAAGSDTPPKMEGLPQGAAVGGWSHNDGKWTATLRADPALSAGMYHVKAVVSGEDWRKTFPVRFVIRPSVSVRTFPYTAGKPSEIEATLLVPGTATARFFTEADTGSLSSSELELGTGETRSLTFTAPENARGPLKLNVVLDNGGEQTVWIRPRNLRVPRAGEIRIDGQLDDWPADRGILGIRSFLLRGLDTDFAPEMRLAWSPEGLYVASRIPVGENMSPPSKPADFWEWTGMEMNINAADVATAPGKVNSHLLYFVPARSSEEGPWHIFAGEWNKTMPDGSKKHLSDDTRTDTAITYENGIMTLEVFIPHAVLEAVPTAGDTWRTTMNSKISRALSPKTVAVWPAGPGSGWESWGLLVFEE